MAVSLAEPESKGNVSNEETESEDLKQFRQEWLQELQKLNDIRSTRTLDAGAAASTSAILLRSSEDLSKVTESTARNLDTNVNKSNETRNTSDHPLLRNGGIGGGGDLPPSLKKALDIYRRAVSHEQIGELDEALLLYRQAFKLV
jgi:F-box protein 9